MATYVNDLRLTEIATGDETGDWGDITNTNLELVAEAFSFGTEAITTNADTHTTTIADGATDPGRSIFLKYTGTLDSACTITIAPNTVSKLWFIENGTSGSQNIIISQGSGANITIPPGDTKAVYSDGAGSGAAMVDAFASLSVVDLKVQDDLTVTDDAAIGGLATVGGTLGVTGVVTANAGVIVDNITIDGTEIDSSGVLTLDAAGQLNLDSGNSEIHLKGQGTLFAKHYVSSGDYYVNNPTQDSDVYITGQRAAGVVTALKFDMSDGGAATFSSSIKTGNTTLQNTQLTQSSGDFVMDVAGNIVLDADGGGVYFKDAGTLIGFFQNDGGDFRIISSVNDKDMKFIGTDNGSLVTALTLDMSAAGAATFNSSITATSLDISGDIDVDGTTNLDVVDIDGAVDMASTLTVGGGVTVKNGATSAGFVEFFEDSDNGTNKVTLIGPASTADVTLTLPASAGTIATTASAADDATALAIALG